MARVLVLLGCLFGCAGSAVQPEPVVANRAAAASAPDPQRASEECRAAVTKHYDDGVQEGIDKAGHRVIVTDSDGCGMTLEFVAFEQNSTRFDPRPVDALASMLACLAQGHIRMRIEVIGHASSDEQDAQALGLARAQAVVAYMNDCGVPTLGLTSTSVGDREPLEGPHNRRDQRVEFLILERSP